jgi:hypothetical protein
VNWKDYIIYQSRILKYNMLMFYLIVYISIFMLSVGKEENQGQFSPALEGLENVGNQGCDLLFVFEVGFSKLPNQITLFEHNTNHDIQGQQAGHHKVRE